jgi:hypothetical protein
MPRARRAIGRAKRRSRLPPICARTAFGRRTRIQRWRAAVAELLDLQAGYTAWLDATDSLRGHGDRGGASASSIWTSKDWLGLSRRADTVATDAATNDG